MYKRKGSPFWHFKLKGVPFNTGTTDDDLAKKEEARVRLQQWEQERFGIKPPRSWQECVIEWGKRKSGKKSWKDDQSRLRWWDQRLGSVQDVRKITRAQIDKLMRTDRGATSSEPTGANATANRYVALLSGILNMARDELEWLDGAPRFVHYPETTGRESWITPEQWIRLSGVLPGHLLGPAQFALATGLRQAKVMRLRWDQIDIKGRWMRFDGTENKRGNVIPLNDTAMAALQMARDAPVVHATRVWLYRGQPFVKPKIGWHNALSKAGLGSYGDGRNWSGFTWHGLRHTYNSWLAQHGTPVDIRKRLAGWAMGGSGRGDIAGRYTHYDLDHLRPYAAIIDSILGSIEGQSHAEGSEKHA